MSSPLASVTIFSYDFFQDGDGKRPFQDKAESHGCEIQGVGGCHLRIRV
jgi:hypothetical protein